MITIYINDREYQVAPAIRAAELLALTLTCPARRILEERDGLLGREFHPDEWIVPAPGDRYQIISYAIGPGGGGDRRVRAIAAAYETEHGDEGAWERFLESDRLDD